MQGHMGHPCSQQMVKEKGDDTGWGGKEGGEWKAGGRGGSSSSTKHINLQKTRISSFLMLTDLFYRRNSQELQYKNDILHVAPAAALQGSSQGTQSSFFHQL